MIVQLGAALSVQVQYIQLRGTTYQFRIRVPKHLVQHYGKPDIRKSLGTSDLKTASRLAEQEARKYPKPEQLQAWQIIANPKTHSGSRMPLRCTSSTGIPPSVRTPPSATSAAYLLYVWKIPKTTTA
jgi:hypothetical protein